MKKLIAFLIVVFITGSASSQRYIKLVNDTNINGQQFYKNEVFRAAEKIENNNLASFYYGNGKITLNKGSYEATENVKSDYSSQKDSLVIKADSVQYRVILAGVTSTDTIRLSGKNNFEVILDTAKEELINADKAGEVFRIIIPGSPSLIYNKSDFKEVVVADGNTEVVLSDRKQSLFDRYKYFLLGVLILSSGFIFLYYRNRKKGDSKVQKEPKRVKYTGVDLSKFADDNNISLKELLSWNKGIIPVEYRKADETKKRKIHNDIRNRKEFLIVGFQQIEVDSENKGRLFEEDTLQSEDLTTATSFLPGDVSLSRDSECIISAIAKLEKSISNKMDDFKTKQNSGEEIGKLRSEYESLSKEFESMKVRNRHLEDNQSKLENDTRTSLELKNTAEEKIKKYTDKLIFTDFLESLASAATEYFSLLKFVEEKAYNTYQKLVQINVKDASLLSHLLTKYQDALPQKWSVWEEICQNIRSVKTISSPAIISSFSQLPNNDEKIRTFRTLLHKEVLEKYSSAVLILAEELKNFSKISGTNNEIIKDIELSFTPLVTDIVNKGKTVGLEINYVPLFESYVPFANKLRATNEKHSLAYENLQFERDSISEIITFGFGNEPTKIILA